MTSHLQTHPMHPSGWSYVVRGVTCTAEQGRIRLTVTAGTASVCLDGGETFATSRWPSVVAEARRRIDVAQLVAAWASPMTTSCTLSTVGPTTPCAKSVEPKRGTTASAIRTSHASILVCASPPSSPQTAAAAVEFTPETP